MIRATRIWTIL